MTNVVTAQINSQLLVFVTDSSVRVLEAKVRTVSDQLIDLIPSTQANAFSLTNLPVGVYTLDVMTQKGNAKAAYEGILVLSQQPTTVISETTRNVINQEINQNSRVVIDDDNDGDDECPEGYVGKPPFCERELPPDPPCPEGEICPEPPLDPPCPGGPEICPDPPPSPGDSEFPNLVNGSDSVESSFTTAKSVVSSVPTTFPLNTLPSASVIFSV
jgi:hypothetical protein